MSGGSPVPDGDPEEIAGRLEGVIAAADMALTQEEIEAIGDAIGYLQQDAERRKEVAD